MTANNTFEKRRTLEEILNDYFDRYIEELKANNKFPADLNEIYLKKLFKKLIRERRNLQNFTDTDINVFIQDSFEIFKK